MQPKVLVLRTAGTNCDYETEHAFQLAGAETALIHINQLITGILCTQSAPPATSLPSPTPHIKQSNNLKTSVSIRAP